MTEKKDGQQEHQHRADDPVLHQRKAEHAPVAEDPAHLLVPDLGQRRVHHQDKADGDGDGGSAHLEKADEVGHTGDKIAQPHPEPHRQEYPERQETVQEGKAAGGRGWLVHVVPLLFILHPGPVRVAFFNLSISLTCTSLMTEVCLRSLAKDLAY